MDGNSIRGNLAKEDIISDIKLSMGADIRKEKVYVIVEGPSDRNFIRKFVSSNVEIYESYDGKQGVEYIAGCFFADEQRIIGIRDRDYQDFSNLKKIFYYDFNCLEMMIVSQDTVFINLCSEYYEGNMTANQLRDLILQELKFLSVIRMMNEREKLEIKLIVSLDVAWDEKQKKLNNSKIIDKLNSINSGFFNEETINKINLEFRNKWKREDYFNYTRGHDFFTLFTTICNQYKKRGKRSDEIEGGARCSYRISEFANTDLYKSLLSYGEQHGLSILLSA